MEMKVRMRQAQRRMKGVKLQYTDEDRVTFADVAGIGAAKVRRRVTAAPVLPRSQGSLDLGRRQDTSVCSPCWSGAQAVSPGLGPVDGRRKQRMLWHFCLGPPFGRLQPCGWAWSCAGQGTCAQPCGPHTSRFFLACRLLAGRCAGRGNAQRRATRTPARSARCVSNP